MANNLLILFGGTTQYEKQEIFNPKELYDNSMDILQINLLSTESNVLFANPSLNDMRWETWLQANPSGLMRHLKADIKNDAPVAVRSALKILKTTIEKIDWSAMNYSANSDARGMNVEAFKKFSYASIQVIQSLLSHASHYQNIFFLAHSRGCSIALRVAGALDNSYLEKIKRVVLLDPVAKNVNDSDDEIIPNNCAVVKALSNLGKEIHLISKSEQSNFDYESFVDQLVGTKWGGRINTGDTSLNMNNICVHLASMVHEGMLGKKFRDNFGAYLRIIKSDDWTNSYANDKKVDLQRMKQSAALQSYISGAKSASEIEFKEGDPFFEFYNQFEVKFTGSLKDRRRAFVHCIATKVAAM